MMYVIATKNSLKRWAYHFFLDLFNASSGLLHIFFASRNYDYITAAALDGEVNSSVRVLADLRESGESCEGGECGEDGDRGFSCISVSALTSSVEPKTKTI